MLVGGKEPQQEFNAKMHNGCGASVNDPVGLAVDGTEDPRIEADEAQGVFGF